MTNDKIGLYFPIDESDQWDGFNNSGIEHFAGSPYAALGREVPQNSLDAANQKKSAIISIDLIEVPINSIPDLEGYKRVIDLCLENAKKESEKAERFFHRAKDILSRSTIKILQISDYNTAGIRGPCENGTPYYAFMKASGQSKKDTDNSIGSFGIGKYAPFLVSELRTVFVSTVWADDKQWNHYVQGRSVLMSHYDESGKTRKGIGFWGIENKCLPVTEFLSTLPEWLLRAKFKEELSAETAGTTLSIIAFDPIKDWQQKIATTIAENFFGAIDKGKLEVRIDNNIHLRKETLSSYFSDDSFRQSVSDMKGEPEKFENSRLFLQTISSNSEVFIEQTQNINLGNCELRILIGENLPKKVAILRDGMLITQELDRLKRFSDFKEFVAVFECLSTKGNSLLRAMEPPRHDDFEPDRLSKEDQAKGRRALKDIADWVRNMLKRHAKDPVSEITSIDELKEFFADESDKGASNHVSEESPTGKILIRARPIKQKKRATVYQDNALVIDDENNCEGSNEGEGEGEGNVRFSTKSANDNENDTKGNSGRGINGNEGEDYNGEKVGHSSVRVELANVRSIPLDSRKRRIAFTPNYSGTIRVEVRDSGADADYRLKVVSTDRGVIENGVIENINIQAGERCIVEIELDEDFFGAMKVVADAI